MNVFTEKNTIKCLGINLPNEVKDLFVLRKLWCWWKKLKTTQTDGKIYCAHRLEELILFKWWFYPRQPTGLCNPFQNDNSILFCRTRKTILKFLRKHKRRWRAKTILGKIKDGSMIISDLKLYHKVAVIKAVWNWQKKICH